MQGQHRILIRYALAHSDFLEQQLAQLAAELEEAARAFHDAVALLETIPCIGQNTTTVILAEIGIDLPLRAASRLLSRGVPRQPTERRQAPGRKDHAWGQTWLRAILGEVVWSLAHTSTTYLATHYRPLARRCGKREAIVAVSHPLLVVSPTCYASSIPTRNLAPTPSIAWTLSECDTTTSTAWSTWGSPSRLLQWRSLDQHPRRIIGRMLTPTLVNAHE